VKNTRARLIRLRAIPLMFLFALIAGMILPIFSTMHIFAQRTTPFDKDDVMIYDAIYGLLYQKVQDAERSSRAKSRSASDNSDFVCGTDNGQLPLESKITSDQYENKGYDIGKGSYSPIISEYSQEKINAPVTLYDSNKPPGEPECRQILALYWNRAYPNADPQKSRQAFLREYYDTTGTQPYELKNGAAKRLYNNLKNYADGRISGHPAEFQAWRDRIINQAFITCYRWNNAAQPESKATDAQKFNKDNWAPLNEGNKSVGYLAEKAIEPGKVSGGEGDGVVGCSQVRDFIFLQSNRYLLNYSTDTLTNDLNNSTNDYKLQKMREKLNEGKNEDIVKVCVAQASVPDSFSQLSLADQISSISYGLIHELDEFEYATNGQGSIKLNALSSAYIAKCLKESPIGEQLDAIKEILVPDTSRVDGGLNEKAVWDCDGIIPTGWLKIAGIPLAPNALFRFDKWFQNAFDWFGCKVTQGVLNVAQKMQETAHAYLETDENYFTSDKIKAAWGNFRNLANILFVIAFLLIIISTVIRGQF